MEKLRQFVQKFLLSIFLLMNLLLIWFTVWGLILWANGMVIKPGCVYIPYSKYRAFFKGTEEEFVKNYENPYSNEKVYLDFEYLGKVRDQRRRWKWTLLDPKTDDFLNMNQLYHEEESDCYIIAVWGGGLEKVYYFLPIEQRRFFTKEELAEEEIRDREKQRIVRVVLRKLDAEEEEKDVVYFYKVKIPQNDGYVYISDRVTRSAYLKYDVLVGNKEIPAYMLERLLKKGHVYMRRYYMNNSDSSIERLHFVRVY